MRLAAGASSRRELLGAALIVSTVTVTAALALDAAKMKLPDGAPVPMMRYVATGFGGFNRGSYVLGEYSGEFSRSESRLSLFGSGFAANRGKSSFSLQGPAGSVGVSGACEFKENVVEIGIVTFDPKKLAYECTITSEDGQHAGRLTVGEPARKTLKERVLAHDIRRGAAEIGGIRIEISSVHELEGSRFVSPAPVGYAFAIDSAIVGALELTDVNPTVLLAPVSEAEIEIAMLSSALALAVLRDPASSALAE